MSKMPHRPRLRVAVVGGDGPSGLYVQIMAAGDGKMLESLKRSKALRPYMQRRSEAAQLVTDLRGLRTYLAEHLRTPLPDALGGGDRVIVSPELKARMLAAGFPDWQRRTSRNLTPKKPRRPRTKRTAPPRGAMMTDRPILFRGRVAGTIERRGE